MHVNFSVALLRRKYFGSEDFSKLDRCVSRFLLPCCVPAEIMVEKKGHVKISVALMRRKFFRSEDFSKFCICVSRYLLPCCIAPRNLGRKRRACENQCCIVASEAF